MILRARPFITQGDDARDRGDWAAAEEAYAAALRRNPFRAGVWGQYGHALMMRERPEEALAAYRKADRLRPAHADTMMHIAHALRTLGREGEARDTYAEVLVAHPEDGHARREMTRLTPRAADFAPDRLGYVMIGTTGLCNASCLHCPTGKAATAHVPRIPMPMALFRRVIDELVELDLPIMGQLAFGLFGDGLVDPFVVERVRYAREKLPYVPISVNSNGAAFDLAKHGALADVPGLIIGLHSESIVPETFNHLMAPLRHERVVVKYEMILRLFGDRTNVSIPVSRANADEVEQTRAWFVERGATVFLVPLMSRCAEDLRLFNQIAISPQPNRCGPDVLDDLAIDCDGLMLACCQDFRRDDPIGNLKTQSLRDVIYGEVRRERLQAFADMEHEKFSTCSKCYGDRIEDVTLAVAEG